jgi:hypothetical protein
MVGEQVIRGRLAELLAAEAADDLSAAEREELERLLADAPPEREQLMRAAGLAQVAFLHRDRKARALPPALRARLAKPGAAWQAGRQSATAAAVTDIGQARLRREDERRGTAPAAIAPAAGAPPVPTPTAARPAGAGPSRAAPGGRGLAGLGWYAAAAVVLVALLVRALPTGAPAPADAAARRAALIAGASDIVRVDWGDSAEPGFERAGGDVVWSSARQEGYLRLAGLPANDRAREQYQLWVVDPGRDARPVDGGVFDVPAAGEVVIPIDAKLRVGRPAAFAITLEKAGGVVVSDGPMLLVAAVDYGTS